MLKQHRLRGYVDGGLPGVIEFDRQIAAKRRPRIPTAQSPRPFRNGEWLARSVCWQACAWVGIRKRVVMRIDIVGGGMHAEARGDDGGGFRFHTFDRRSRRVSFNRHVKTTGAEESGLHLKI